MTVRGIGERLAADFRKGLPGKLRGLGCQVSEVDLIQMSSLNEEDLLLIIAFDATAKGLRCRWQSRSGGTAELAPPGLHIAEDTFFLPCGAGLAVARVIWMAGDRVLDQRLDLTLAAGSWKLPAQFGASGLDPDVYKGLRSANLDLEEDIREEVDRALMGVRQGVQDFLTRLKDLERQRVAGGPPPDFVALLDRDHDGRVSSAECTLSDRSVYYLFDGLDVDSDGYITPAEVAGLHARLREVKAQYTDVDYRREPGWKGTLRDVRIHGTPDIPLPGFKRQQLMQLDKNVDGALSPEERGTSLVWRLAFALEDANRNGLVGIGEMAAFEAVIEERRASPLKPVSGFMALYDEDRDRRISHEEWRRQSGIADDQERNRLFMALDGDYDGTVTAAEHAAFVAELRPTAPLTGPRPPGQVEPWGQSYEELKGAGRPLGSGSLTKCEFFLQDSNGDGYVSRGELKAFGETVEQRLKTRGNDLFGFLDRDGDGRLDRMMEWGRGSLGSELEALSEDGWITWSKYRGFRAQLREQMKRGIQDPYMRKLREEEASKWIERIDGAGNRDGKVSANEINPQRDEYDWLKFLLCDVDGDGTVTAEERAATRQVLSDLGR